MRTLINGIFGVIAVVAPQIGLYFLYTQAGGYENPLFWLGVSVDALFLLHTFNER